MKAIVLTGLREMAEVDVPEPACGEPDDVLLAVEVVGVCGSDVHYYETGRIGSQVVSYPYRVGHECSATVLAVGPGVTRVRPGDRVAVEPALACGTCDQCTGGRPHTCRRLRFLGCPGQADGCLCERIVMPEACCFPVDPATTLEEATLAEPLSIGVYAGVLANLRPGMRIGILGCGPIGLSVMLPALAAGVHPIYVTDRIDARLDLARACGATWAGHVEHTDVVAAIRAHEPLLLDTVFECCGEQAAIDQALALLKPGGTLMLIGIPRADRITLAIDTMRRKELRVQNVRRQNHCMQKALDLIAQRRIDIAPLITHRFAAAQTRDAFDLVAAYGDGVMKAVIAMNA